MKSLRTKALVVAMALATALAVGLVSSYASSSKGKVTRAGHGLKPGANATGGWTIKDGTIKQWKLAPHTLGHSRIGNDAIQANNIAHGAVNTAQIADGAVGTAEIADGSVTAAKLESSFLGSLFVNDPATTQIVTYSGTAVGTILQMASGAAADPLEIQDSNGNDVFAVGPDGSFMSDAGAIWSDGLGNLNVGGAFSTDGGTIWTDGVGDLTVTGSFSTDAGGITSDGNGDLTVTGDLTSGGTIYGEGSTDGYGNAAVLDGGGLAIDTPNYAGNYIDLGFGTTTVDQFGNLTTLGSFSTDNSSIYSNGLGNLTVEGVLDTGSLKSDGGMITSNGSGNLSAVTITSNAVAGNSFVSTGFTVDSTGVLSALTVAATSTANGTVFSAGGDTINGQTGALSVAGLITASGGITVSGLTSLGDLRVTGTDVFTATPTSVDASANPILSAGNLLTNKIITIAQTAGAGTVTTDSAASIVAALPGTPAVGDTFLFSVYNDTGGSQAITPGPGVTFLPGGTIADARVAQFECNVTSVTGGSEGVTCYVSGG